MMRLSFMYLGSAVLPLAVIGLPVSDHITTLQSSFAAHPQPGVLERRHLLDPREPGRVTHLLNDAMNILRLTPEEQDWVEAFLKLCIEKKVSFLTFPTFP